MKKGAPSPELIKFAIKIIVDALLLIGKANIFLIWEENQSLLNLTQIINSYHLIRRITRNFCLGTIYQKL